VSDEAKVGTCKACGQQLLLTKDDCWHPHTVAVACPPEVDLGFSVKVPMWGGFLRPGAVLFIEDEVQPE
jgi:hypothetical protein